MLARDPEDYDRLNLDDREVEKGPLGAIFPHDLGVLSDTQLPAELPWTPFIDKWTLELALTILKEEQLGQDDVPDMLCVSFSAMDYVHHRYGPDSLESEDTLYRVDALIARLLNELDGLVGLEHTLIAVSSDHGFGRAPEQVRAEGLSAERITRDQLEAQLADLSDQLSRSAGSSITARFMSPFIYLRHENGQPVNPSLREKAVRIAGTWSWTAWVATADLLRTGGVPRDALFERATTSFRADRGGDVLVIVRPWYIVETAETAWSATHGSPYNYDTRVPVLFAGAGLSPAQITRPITPLDIPATLAACLNITPPPACSGTPLPEIVGGITGR
ncbi:MAG: alkaline phosphatase family protein [Candidatus Hydrogenedentes bacterium]|nr:alkaline phosphatase family protein [Candidatus Hydrogenedentota bacterium]